jgi:hypothetical protein
MALLRRPVQGMQVAGRAAYLHYQLLQSMAPSRNVPSTWPLHATSRRPQIRGAMSQQPHCYLLPSLHYTATHGPLSLPDSCTSRFSGFNMCHIVQHICIVWLRATAEVQGLGSWVPFSQRVLGTQGLQRCSVQSACVQLVVSLGCLSISRLPLLSSPPSLPLLRTCTPQAARLMHTLCCQGFTPRQDCIRADCHPLQNAAAQACAAKCGRPGMRCTHYMLPKVAAARAPGRAVGAHIGAVGALAPQAARVAVGRVLILPPQRRLRRAAVLALLQQDACMHPRRLSQPSCSGVSACHLTVCNAASEHATPLTATQRRACGKDHA